MSGDTTLFLKNDDRDRLDALVETMQHMRCYNWAQLTRQSVLRLAIRVIEDKIHTESRSIDELLEGLR